MSEKLNTKNVSVICVDENFITNHGETPKGAKVWTEEMEHFYLEFDPRNFKIRPTAYPEQEEDNFDLMKLIQRCKEINPRFSCRDFKIYPLRNNAELHAIECLI